MHCRAHVHGPVTSTLPIHCIIRLSTMSAAVTDQGGSSSVSAAATATSLQSNRSLYVGGLAEDVTPITLRAALVPFGPIKSIDVPMDYGKGTHKGFAFVEFEESEDAAEAIYNLDGSELMGRTLTVNLARAAGQVKLGSNQAVWSQDEWFQNQTGEREKAEMEEQQKRDKDDAETMKER